MKVAVNAGKVLGEKKDVESACECHRKSTPSRSVCELVVNVLLFIVALIFIGLGAYSWNQIVFGKPQPMMMSSVYTSTNITSTYYGVPQGPSPPRDLVSVYPGSASPSFTDAIAALPVVNSGDLPNWPGVFQREGWMEVSSGSFVSCRFPQGTANLPRSCLIQCYSAIDKGFIPVRYQPSDKDICNEMGDTSEKKFQSLPPAPPSKNFSVLPYTKLFPITVSRPLVTIKIPLLDLPYSDLTKICLSFCALHPRCDACSAFPDDPVYVLHSLDRMVSPAGYNGTLSCWLLTEGPTGPAATNTRSDTFTLFPSPNAMTYLLRNSR